MHDDCNGDIPASSFARAAAALAIETTSPTNDVPDSDSSISDSSHDINGNSSYKEKSVNTDYLDASNEHKDMLDEGPSNVLEGEVGADRNSVETLDERNADLQHSRKLLDAPKLSPSIHNDNNQDEIVVGGNDLLETQNEGEHSPTPSPCELTPETSNGSNDGLFESDITIENRGSNQEQTLFPKLSQSVDNKRIVDYQEDDVYNLCTTYAHSPASFADSSCSFMPSPTPSTTKIKKSISKNTEHSSILSRGMSIFGRKTLSSRWEQSNNDFDASSVISDLSRDGRSEKSSSTLQTATISKQKVQEETRLQKHLQESGLVLVKRLVEFLSACPLAFDEEMQETVDAGGEKSLVSNGSRTGQKNSRGLMLPACAVGWISYQIAKCSGDAHIPSESPDENALDCDQVPKQQLDCLQTLLRRVINLRLTNDKWPPPLTPLISETADVVKRKAFSSIPETGIVSSRILSKFTDQSSVTGRNSIDEESVSSGTTKGTPITPFQRYFHELQYNPNVDMRLFPNATKVIIDGIPPSWISNLDTLKKLDMFQMEKGCILDFNQLFFPSDKLAVASITPDTHLLFMYKSLTNLRISNCAMSEAAGLRGRRRSKLIPKIAALSRFPNLKSLNMSHNELFRTKTALAGLSSLPLLSSIDLSYNRLSSLNDIYMYLGNIKELILSGNDLSSTQGLDRLYSLERLSLDENKIQHLSDLSSLAKLPFLMNLDIKDNPLERADPASCRIEVFNMFREVRCKSMPKNATYRNMQQLLPVLDNILATKDELVVIKNLTFRQAVSIDTRYSSEITESTEMKINMVEQTGRRCVTKVSLPRKIHFRTVDGHPLIANHKTLRHAKYRDTTQINVKYSIEDVIASIRPNMEIGENSTLLQNYQRSQTLSFFNQSKFDRDAGGLGAGFPFTLPSSILEEADDDLWKPIPLCETLPDYEPSVAVNEFTFENNTGLVSNESICSSLSCDQDLSSDVANSPSNEYRKRIHADSMGLFEGLWKHTYRENAVSNTAISDVDSSATNTVLTPVDYNEEEVNTTYDGPLDYSSIVVSSDLDLYFDSYVFPRASDNNPPEEILMKQNLSPRIQLFKFDRNALNMASSYHEDLRERYIGVWKEDVVACGSFARSRIKSVRLPKRGFHGENITRSGEDTFVSESRKIVVCLSDSAFYLIIDDDFNPTKTKTESSKRAFPSMIPTAATFRDAYWPHALIRHSLDCLVSITIGFQFQRLLLRFSVSNSNGVSLEYTYVLLTSNKLETISLFQKLQSNLVQKNAVLIENDDKVFFDALGAKTDEVVLHYQILYQLWKKGDKQPARRSFVLTVSTIFLLDEYYDGDGSTLNMNVRRLGDISLDVIDSASLNRVSEIRAANEDPRMITLVILPLNKLKRAHRWRLLCNDGDGAERLIDDVRKAIGN